MTRPTVKNVEAAIRIYYGKAYISCSEIEEIFGKMGSARMARLRKDVREEEINRKIPIVVPRHICTEVAFDVWGIDIDKLVKNYQKLQKLNHHVKVIYPHF